MARTKPGSKTEFEQFDVLYEDGTQTSNRKIPKGEISDLERDQSLRQFFEAQDAEIAERSGRRRAAISSIEPSRAR